MNSKNAILGLLAGAALALSALPAHHSLAAPAPAKGIFYLALGDSLSAGYQPDPAISWAHGWVYQLRDILAKRAPTELTDLAIGGECTATFIRGGLSRGCPTKAVTSPSQMAEAVSYIKAHSDQVKLITVEVGGDNLYGHMTAFLKDTPAQGQALLQGLFPPLGSDWTTIFTTLRQACMSCEIIAVDQYNPIPAGTTKADVALATTTYNGLLKQVTASLHIRLADVYTPFFGHEILYTWIARGDIHANTAGYAVMAKTVAGLIP